MSLARTFHFKKGRDGLGIVTIDMPGEKINKLSRFLFNEVLDLIQTFETAEDLKGIVLISGKEDNFIAGANIDDFLAFMNVEDAEAMSRKGQEILAKFESLRFPVVAAIHGACLGGGFETALACHYRICTDSSRTILGQPEVQLGLVPGGGATQRLPRLIGLARALDLILTGRNVRPREALRLGLVDQVVPRESLAVAARHAVIDLAEGRCRPRRLGIRELSDLFRVRTWKWLLTDKNPMARAVVCRIAKRQVLARTRGLYPAPLKALECVRAGLSQGTRRGYALERRSFAELGMTDACRQLIGLFFAINSIKKETGVSDPSIRPRQVEYLGILGSGFMGSGIAAVSAHAGIQTRMKDQSVEALGKGLRFCHDFFQEKRKRRTLSQLEFQQKLDTFSGGLDYSGFRRADLVIEAVFEDLTLKHQVLREVEQHMREDAIFGSNTSSISIDRIAQASRRPENVLGMHFFSPVARMPLVEIIVTPATSAKTLATAMAYAKRIDKTPIVVKDGTGFYTSRILAPYVNEALYLLEEGASIEAIDGAMVRFGYPVGPLALLDEVGMDVANKVARIMEEAFGARLKPPASAQKIAEGGRLGRKSGLGFYRYEAKKKEVDTRIYRLLPGGSRRTPKRVEEIQSRLAMAMVNEAILCLQEGILRSPRDGDVGAVLGLGFPPFRGGPLRYVDSLGAAKVLDQLNRLAESSPLRFAPAPLLVEMARQSWKFYPLKDSL